MTSRRSIVTASKDIWGPQALGDAGMAGLLPGVFVAEPREMFQKAQNL